MTRPKVLTLILAAALLISPFEFVVHASTPSPAPTKKTTVKKTTSKKLSRRKFPTQIHKL